MITPSQLQARVLQVVDLVLEGRKPEDQTVELKSRWIEPIHKMARHIAAHANASRGNDILWIIGVDDDGRKVTGADGKEISNWYSRMVSEFEQSVAPELLLHRVCMHEQGPVVAMLFSTSAAPYVVRIHDKEAGGFQPKHEVPFRQGNSTRTATRTDLLRMLAPPALLPSMEPLNCSLRLYPGRSRGLPNAIIQMNAFVSAPNGAKLAMPYHKCFARITSRDAICHRSLSFAAKGFRFLPCEQGDPVQSVAIVDRAAYIQAIVEAETDWSPDTHDSVHLVMSFGFPDTALTLDHHMPLRPQLGGGKNSRLSWAWLSRHEQEAIE
ncbi:ATP-binding protein [Polyangium jinanense]|uniref:AlbA family DNA-binding domain-containing protein n=1 Tax=Polyangium jinanense TaxID=2829994 RepID=UPI002341D0EC|nr:ATP-binding protein [Polyangium jinanense]MDC3960717.1 ATP-binding protein [Polyangium jinanense]